MYKLKLYLLDPISILSKLLYFIFHPIILIKNKLNIQKLERTNLINMTDSVSSNLPIDIIFPTIEKDFIVVTHMIDSVREYIKHPIGKIFIISPPSEEIINLCKEKNCVFVDENFVLPITIKDISYIHKGKNRSGWLFQQLLKWGANKLGENKHFLITESDTVFIRPRVFEYNGKYVVPCSSEFPHIPYFKTYKKLLGEEIIPIMNFTAHHCLYSKDILAELKDKIKKKHGKVWYQAIINCMDTSEGSYVSDYETYQQYLYKHYPEKVYLEYWGNISLNRDKVKNLSNLKKNLRSKYKVISFHSYNR